MNFWKHQIGTMGLLAFLVANAMLNASDTLPPPAVNSTQDLDVTHRARQALAAEPELKDVHVLISVVDGGLVAGGPVASLDVASRIERVLKSVPGVRSVRMSCWVPTSLADPLRDAVRKRMDPGASNLAMNADRADPGFNRSPIPVPRPPGSPQLALADRSGTPDSKRFAAALPPLWPPLADTTSNHSGKVMVQRYSPVPPPVPPAPSGAAIYPTIVPPALPIAPTQDVASALELIRQTDSRYQHLRMTSQGGLVTIEGIVKDLGDAWELAEKLRSVPGVDRIILGQIRER